MLCNGANHTSVAASVRMLFTVFTAPTQLGQTIDSRIGGGIGNAKNYGFPSALRSSVVTTLPADSEFFMPSP